MEKFEQSLGRDDLAPLNLNQKEPKKVRRAPADAAAPTSEPNPKPRVRSADSDDFDHERHGSLGIKKR